MTAMGWDILQDIRKHFYDLPVILATAYDSFKEDMKSIAADFYVVKSFDLTELKAKIALALEPSLSDFALQPRPAAPAWLVEMSIIGCTLTYLLGIKSFCQRDWRVYPRPGPLIVWCGQTASWRLRVFSKQLTPAPSGLTLRITMFRNETMDAVEIDSINGALTICQCSVSSVDRYLHDTHSSIRQKLWPSAF